MVAKRNAEVEKLNALARERMKAEGRLGERGDRGRRRPASLPAIRSSPGSTTTAHEHLQPRALAGGGG